MHDLDRVRFLSRTFPLLQGLKLSLISFYALVSHLTAPYWSPASKSGTLTGWVLHSLFLGAMLFLYWRVDLFYKRTFGQVKSKGHTLGILLLWSPMALLFGALFVAATWIEYWLASPVSLLALVGAGFVVWFWLYPGWPRQRWHWGVIALLFAASAFVPLLLPGSPSELYTDMRYFRIAMISGNLVFMVGGLLDHLLLVRSFSPLPEEAQADVA